MDLSRQLHPNPTIDKIYVLSVKTFTDRINHIKTEFLKQNLNFEFIFDFDIPDLTSSQEYNNFSQGCDLSLAHKSLIKKHIRAWQMCVLNNLDNVLVLEDDVILNKDFKKILNQITFRVNHINPGYLIFLGGKDTKVPLNYLLSNDIIFKNKIPTAEGYVTDFLACSKRLDWLKNKVINLPADHLINLIDSQVGNTQYWSTQAIVEQGSVFGLFSSTLDNKRMKKSKLHNQLRYFLKIFTRRSIPKLLLWVARKKIK